MGNSRRRNDNRRIVRYKAPINLNAGVVIFGIIFLYIIINLFLYFTANRVTYYEVTSGAVSDDSERTFKALAVRSEDVSYAEHSGYINFYSRENTRVSKTTTLYSIDESGKINQLLAQMSEDEKKLSEENIASLKEELYNFSSNYDQMNYDSVYDFKNSLQGMVVELINNNAINSIYSSLGDSQSGQFQIKTPENSGIVEYFIDNYENFKVEDTKESDFDLDNYTSVKINSGDLVEKDSPIYKTITQEEWQLVIQLDEQNYEKYRFTTAMQIRFKKDDTKVRTNFEIIDGADNKHYGVLTFQKYLIKYATERYIDIEITDYNVVRTSDDKTDSNSDAIEIDNRTPLKIPKSAILTKDYYVIPKEYKTIGSDSENSGFIIYDPTSESTDAVFKTISIFYEDDTYCYVDKSKLEAGVSIIRPKQVGTTSEDTPISTDEVSQTYVVKETQGLTGVYNINNGYTQFTGIEIAAEAGDFYIVYAFNESDLMVYDHIILNADKVDENQVIFQTPNE